MNTTTVKLASGVIPEAAKTSPLNGHRLALLLLVLAYTLSIADRMILSILFSVCWGASPSPCFTQH
jgi:hypothetical protein